MIRGGLVLEIVSSNASARYKMVWLDGRIVTEAKIKSKHSSFEPSIMNCLTQKI